MNCGAEIAAIRDGKYLSAGRYFLKAYSIMS